MKSFLSLAFITAVAVAAENPETLAERSQARARQILDAAVEAMGGAEAIQAVDTVRLNLKGQTYPRLQMPTPEPPFEPGQFDETLLFDLKNNRLLLEQRGSGAGFEGSNKIVLKAGEGTNYDFRARTVTPIPAAQTSQQQFIQYYRRLPNLILRQALDRASSLRSLGEDQFNGSKHDVITFVMPDAQQVALYVDAKSGLISKYELIYTDPLSGEEASEIMFADYTTSGKLKVPQKWVWRQAGDILARYDVRAEFNPSITDKSFEVAADRKSTRLNSSHSQISYAVFCLKKKKKTKKKLI